MKKSSKKVAKKFAHIENSPYLCNAKQKTTVLKTKATKAHQSKSQVAKPSLAEVKAEVNSE